MAHRDLIIVGGGLSGSLAAWLIKSRVPGIRLLLVERAAVLGGNHTWSFFETDLMAADRVAIAPLVCASWPGYDVKFPGYERRLSTGYRSIFSSRLHDVIAGDLGDDVSLGRDIAEVQPDHVRFADGEVARAPCVIDARGAAQMSNLMLGYQKFLGLEIELKKPHGEKLPVIMDASVHQNDGYRFVYTLPLAPDRILIEDTYYSDGAGLPSETLNTRIHDYAEQRGWRIGSIARKEHGVLPIILAGEIEAYIARLGRGAPRIGLAAAFFHPTTGYSLPDAVRIAGMLCREATSPRPFTSAGVRARLVAMARDLWRERSFFRMLNRMLFCAGDPSRRYKVFERFYRLDPGLMQRFYAAELTTADRIRIVSGRPPVPLLPAIACLSEQRMLRMHSLGAAPT